MCLSMVFCIHSVYYQHPALHGMLVCSIKYLHVSSMHLDMIVLLNTLKTLHLCQRCDRLPELALLNTWHKPLSCLLNLNREYHYASLNLKVSFAANTSYTQVHFGINSPVSEVSWERFTPPFEPLNVASGTLRGNQLDLCSAI